MYLLKENIINKIFPSNDDSIEINIENIKKISEKKELINKLKKDIPEWPLNLSEWFSSIVALLIPTITPLIKEYLENSSFILNLFK